MMRQHGLQGPRTLETPHSDAVSTRPEDLTAQVQSFHALIRAARRAHCRLNSEEQRELAQLAQILSVLLEEADAPDPA
jgi:hypothetical protein